MRISRCILPALAVALFSFLLLASSALAGTPSTVTVRVVGLTGTTLLPQTQVTTTSTPIDPDGNPSDTCTGTSAAGALDDAIRGNWVVLYENATLGYQIDGVQGLNFPAFSSNPDAYWSFWLNDVPSSVGACGAELSQGDEVVFFAQCYQQGTDCPTGAVAPAHFLTETAPSSSSVQVGTSVSVTVGSLNAETGDVESSVPSETTVTASSVSTVPNTQGVATLTFTKVGIYTIEAAAPDSVPSAPRTICVHNGNDGNCGTTLTSGSVSTTTTTTTTTTGAPQMVVSDVAKIAGVKNGHAYSRRSAPRLLAGVIEIPAGGTLRQVRISLQRRYRGRCFDFSGSRESFVRTKKCGSADFFSVGGSESFSYLLPARLPKGSYVYDIEGVDSTGQTTKLVSGVSHVVFQVK
jgi:hypothetical protein